MMRKYRTVISKLIYKMEEFSISVFDTTITPVGDDLN